MKSPRVILTCKQVSRILLEEHFQELPCHKKLAIKFHLSWCWICGNFNKQVIAMQNGIDSLIEHEDKDPPPSGMEMPPESKDRILKAIREKKE